MCICVYGCMSTTQVFDCMCARTCVRVCVHSGVKCVKCLHWGCVPGYFGSDCVDACLLNPCEHTSSCVRKPLSKHGYTCECGHNYYGQYCQHR